jgi:cytochrome c oxidase subunit 2
MSAQGRSVAPGYRAHAPALPGTARVACALVACALVAVVFAGPAAGAALPAQSALDPAGPQAARIGALWNVMLGLCTLVWILVVGAAWLAVLRQRRRALEEPQLAQRGDVARRLDRVIGVAVGLSALGLIALVVASVTTDRALAHLPHDDALHVRLTAHQWWWEARYDDADPSKMFSTANELHIPVGRPVLLTLEADDVIHSFWVPNLHGKTDLIPGRTNTTLLRADAPGIYRGQCAEFCGYQHAHMSLLVIADAPADYARWSQAQRQPAPAPSTPELAAGQRVFETSTCAMCHAVQGTTAQAQRAPDLTHVASRLTLAAVTLDNTPGNRAAWVMDPQHLKPGVNMPANSLPPDEMGPLLAWLGTLR